MNRPLFFAIGFLLWLLATIAFRLSGHLFFLDDPAVMVALWLITVPALFLLASGLFRWRKLRRAERFEAAVLLVISGMTLDASSPRAFRRLPQHAGYGGRAFRRLAADRLCQRAARRFHPDKRLAIDHPHAAGAARSP